MPSDIMWEAHEQRLQATEKALAEFAAKQSGDVLRFQMLSDQITGLNSTLTESFDKLDKRVDDLYARQLEHHRILMTVNAETERSVERKKKMRKVLLAIGTAFVGSLMEPFGLDIWGWLRHLPHK